MAHSKAELEKENARLWEKLEAIYEDLQELFDNDEGEEEEESDDEEM